MERIARLSRLRPALSPLETARHAAGLRHGALNTRRGVSGSSGGPVPEIKRLQRVRFVKPKPKRGLFRRSLRWTIPILIFYLAGIVRIEFVDEDEEEEEEKGEDGKEEEEGENRHYARFYPFPFTERVIEQPFYPPGPERDALMKIRRDLEFCTKLRARLANKVRDIYGYNDRLVASYGKARPGDIKYNISLHFHNRPHPQWSQSGIFITEDALAWGEKQPVDPNAVAMARKLFWPAPAASALWRFSKTVTTQTFGYLFGVPDPPPPLTNAYGVPVDQNSGEKRAQMPLQFRPQLPGAPGAGPSTADSKNGSRPVTPQESRQHGAKVASSNVQGDGAAARKDAAGKDAPGKDAAGKDAARKDAAGKDAAAPSSWSDSLLRLHSDLITVPAPPMHDLFPSAWQRLMLDLRAIGKREPAAPPPGCVKLSGVVGVRTNTHVVLLGAVVYYDPKVDDFDKRSARYIFHGVRPLIDPRWS